MSAQKKAGAALRQASGLYPRGRGYPGGLMAINWL